VVGGEELKFVGKDKSVSKHREDQVDGACSCAENFSGPD
jgi:hypothetical protein